MYIVGAKLGRKGKIMEKNNNKNAANNHEHSHKHNCSCGEEYYHSHSHDHCDCENHGHQHNCNHSGPQLVKMCVLEDGVRCTNCGACDMCDLDPEKVCDNCGKCLDTLNTNEKGFVEVPVDKIIMGEGVDELNQLYAMYGLLDDDEDEEEEDV